MAITGGPTVTLRFKGDADDLHRTVDGIKATVAGLGATMGGLAAGVGIFGALGAAASATVVAVAAVPLAFAGLGIAAAAQTEEVKTRFKGMWESLVAQTTEMAKPIQFELMNVADMIEASFSRIAPSLTRIFEMTAPHIRIFTEGLLGLIERAMPGFEVAISRATPLVQSFSGGLATLGEGIGGFFAALTEGTPGAVEGMNALFLLTKDLLIYLGQLVGALANSLGPAFRDLEPSLMAIVRALGDGLLRIAQALAPYIGELGRNIADFLTAALNAALPVVEAIIPLLAEFGSMILESVTPILRDLGPVLADVVRALADGLRPVIPVVRDAFREMTPVIREIAEQAGPLLAEIIRALAPLFLELVRSALELTKALLPVIPPLLEMANNAMPLVAGVIRDVLIPIVQFLTREFVGLIDYGQKIIERFGELSVRWRTYWDEIKAAFADANAKIRAGIDSFVSLGETARKHWDAMYQAIKGKIEEIVAWAVNFPQRIIDAIMGYVTRFRDAGAALIEGFSQGIESKAERAKEAGIVAVGATESVFPQSPPPEGPFAGSGWTYFRGQSLIEGFIEGIRTAAPRLYNAVTDVMGRAQISMNDLGSAAQELLNHLGKGGALAEDFSFAGMSANLGKVNDQLAAMFQAAGGGGAGQLRDWASKMFGLVQAEDLSWVKGGFYGGGGAAAAGPLAMQLQVSPGADNALSSMLMQLVRTGQLQLARA
jgi:phage-related protein